MEVKFYMLPLAFWEGKSATLPFRMTNTVHLKRSQYQILVLSFLPFWTFSCVGCLKYLSLAECIVSVSKNKFTSFHLGIAYYRCFGSLCALLSTELWLYMRTVSGGKDGRKYIPVHDLCSSLSNITCQILPSLHALTGCDTTFAFFRIGKNLYTKSWKHYLKSCLI